MKASIPTFVIDLKMKKIKLFSIFTIIFLSTFAQDNNYIKSRATGMSLAYGIPLYELPEGGRYKPYVFQYYYRMPLFIKNVKKTNLLLSIKPQYNPVLVSTKYQHEFGINVCFEASYLMSFTDIISIYAGSGPHYISYQSKRQAKGFIFSDNFILSWKHLLKNKPSFEMEIYSGIRHISNATLKRPNGGINNWMVGLSFGRVF